MGNGVRAYYPELGDRRPDCEIEADLAYYGKHYFLETKLDLKGKGVTFVKKFGADDFKDGENNRKCGWNQYMVTLKAFEKIKQEHAVSKTIYLD